MSGRVILVGAGPGDPGLMTVRGAEAVAEADVILYDQLIPPTALDGARDDALLIDVGKVGGGAQVPQEQTERLLLEHARAGAMVVRLKGGDPFVFGRGGEEALLCREHGIPFEVVPGVTAGIAGPAYAGIPVTQRGLATGVAFVTGHEDPAKLEQAGSQLDWTALAAFPGTLVFYMGVRALPRIAERLIAGGRPAAEPAAIVQRGTLPDQRAVHGTLETIAARAAEEGIRAPSVTVIGPVAALGEQLAWVGVGPLAGISITVTRSRAQAGGLARQLRDLGARVVEAAVIRPQPLEFSVPALDDVDLLVLSSPNGAARFFAQLRASGRDARALAGTRIAVIGPGTADAVREHGVEPDLIPRKAVGESLAELLTAHGEFRHALVVRARGARTVIADALAEAGTPRVDVIEPYVTVAEPLDERTRSRALGADWATFTSASSARFFCEAAGGAGGVRKSGLRLASIGPVTSAALRELGLEPNLEAAEHTPAGLTAALLATCHTIDPLT